MSIVPTKQKHTRGKSQTRSSFGMKKYRNRHKITIQNNTKLIWNMNKKLVNTLRKHGKVIKAYNEIDKHWSCCLTNHKGNATLSLISLQLPLNIKLIECEFTINFTIPISKDFPCTKSYTFTDQSNQSKYIHIGPMNNPVLTGLKDTQIMIDIQIIKIMNSNDEWVCPTNWKAYDIECLSDSDDEYEVKNNRNSLLITKLTSNPFNPISNDMSDRLWQAENAIQKLSERYEEDIITLQMAMLNLRDKMDKQTQKLNEQNHKINNLLNERNLSNKQRNYSTTQTTYETPETSTNDLINPSGTLYSHLSNTDQYLGINSTQPISGEIEDISAVNININETANEITIEPQKQSAVEETEQTEHSFSEFKNNCENNCGTNDIIEMLNETGFNVVNNHCNIAMDRYEDNIIEYFDSNQINGTAICNMSKIDFIDSVNNYMNIDETCALTLNKPLSKLYRIIKTFSELHSYISNNDIVNVHLNDDKTMNDNTPNEFQLKWKVKDFSKFLNEPQIGKAYGTKRMTIQVERYKVDLDFIIYPFGQYSNDKGYVQCVLNMISLPKVIDNITLCIYICCKYENTIRKFKTLKTFKKNGDCVGWDTYSLAFNIIQTQNDMKDIKCSPLDFCCNFDILRIKFKNRNKLNNYNNFYKSIDMPLFVPFIWNVDEEFFLKMKYSQFGSVFYSDAFGNNCWCLKIQPNGSHKGNKGSFIVSLILLRLDNNIKSLTANYCLKFNDETINGRQDFNYDTASTLSINAFKSQWLLSVPNNQLCIHVEIKVLKIINKNGKADNVVNKVNSRHYPL